MPSIKERLEEIIITLIIKEEKRVSKVLIKSSKISES